MPTLLDPPLRTTQHPIDQKGVCVSGDLSRDPGCHPDQGLSQCLSEPENPLQARKGNLDLLPGPTALLGLLGH